MKGLMKGLLYVGLLLLSPEIFAGVFDADRSPNDLSVRLLGIIFGSNIGDIALAGGKANPTMSALMEKFNFIIVLVGTIVVSYVGIMSTINTAQEGTAMGKKWSAVWVPLRSLAGMALMIPSPGSGYSMIQVTVMWIILQGIGAADALWNITLDNLRSGSTPSGVLASTQDLPTSTDAFALTHAILDAAICMKTLEVQSKSNENKDGNTWLFRNGSSLQAFAGSETATVFPRIDDPNPTRATVSGTYYFGVKDPLDTKHKDICGSIKVESLVEAREYASPPDGTTLLNDALKIYTAKQLAISTMLSSLDGLASGLVKPENAPKALYDDPQPNQQPNPAGFRSKSIDSYMKAMSGLVITDTLNSSDKQRAINDAADQGQDMGWIVAGSYYFILNQTLVSKIFANAKVAPIIGSNNIKCRFDSSNVSDCQIRAYTSGGDPFDPENNSTSGAFGTALANADIKSVSDRIALANNLAKGSVYLNFDLGASSTQLNFSTGSTDAGGGPMGAMLAPLREAGTGAVNAMMNIMGNNKDIDPLLAHSMVGRDIMFACEMAWILIFGISFGISLAVGFWGVLSGFATWLLGLLAVVSPLLGTMWAIGASLAIYSPLIPYMIFTLTALGWLLIVVEAIIAAPLIALGLVVPSGDEMGKLEVALMLLANIFLRPMLMIFGFLLAGSVYKAAVVLINTGMASVFQTIDVNTLFSSIVIMALYATFIISVTNVSFSLIYAVPDKVLRWMGGGPEQTDVSAMSEAKAGAAGASKMVGSQAGGGAAAVGNKAVARSEGQKTAKKAK